MDRNRRRRVRYGTEILKIWSASDPVRGITAAVIGPLQNRLYSFTMRGVGRSVADWSEPFKHYCPTISISETRQEAQLTGVCRCRRTITIMGTASGPQFGLDIEGELIVREEALSPSVTSKLSISLNNRSNDHKAILDRPADAGVFSSRQNET